MILRTRAPACPTSSCFTGRRRGVRRRPTAAQFDTLYCEGNPPKDLVRQAVAAEEAGFDFLVISDHYHPWLTSQEHSAFAWSVLGAVAQATERIELATIVTCPIIRYHPAVVAQIAATVAILSDERFTLGLGAGERLNEHVVGRGWPPVVVRHEMVREVIGVIEELWKGGYVSHRGEHFVVEDARIFDLPERPIQTYVAAGGRRAARLAAEVAGGVCATEPREDIVAAFHEAGGSRGATWGQWSWDGLRTRRPALATPTPSSGLRWAAGRSNRAANPVNFDAATQNVKPKPADLADTIPAGPDPDRHAEAVRAYLDAGYEHVAVAYPGNDPGGFMRFWSEELRPHLQ